MPQPGMRWRLVTINTHGSWLHGSPRGFRSRHHRIHSSGDYRNPPPHGEHAGLHRHQLAQSAPPSRIEHEWKPTIGSVLRDHLEGNGYRVLAVFVCFDHAHVVVELPDVPTLIRAIVGDAKRTSSRSIPARGTLWSAGCDARPKDRKWSLAGAVRYVRDRQGAGSWTWSYRDVAGAYR